MSSAVDESVRRAQPKRPNALVSERLAAFARTLSFDQLPASVVERAKLSILDCLGIGLASTTFDFGQKTIAAVQAMAGPGPSPVIGTAISLPQRDAVLVNGTLIHGLDFDDTHADSVVHCSASAVPVVLACALQNRATGREAMTAYVIAVEADARIGMGANGGFHQQGYHPTGLVGAFGCALAAGRLMQLGERELVHAQGITLSMASGNLEFLEDGAWTKRMHPGWAGVCGITAAAMAKGGYVGPSRAYEGRYGLYNTHAAADVRTSAAVAAADLGQRWESLRVAFKPFPACHYNHAFADAALALRAQYGLRPEEVSEIVARISEKQVAVVCEPEANKKRPQNSYDAQFSVHFTIAAALVRGQFTLEELEPEVIADPAILALCARTRYELDPGSAFPKFYSGEVEIRTKDGRILVHREQENRGSDANPLSDADIIAKFRANARRVIEDSQAQEIVDLSLSLDRAPNLERLAAALQTRRH
ncbi:MAG: MmgE/PrpD family protein [Alphaproteobacteria bacterium]|nr:MmgE/PrpD family protein [Alphaproteobacteria bacterium]